MEGSETTIFGSFRDASNIDRNIIYIKKIDLFDSSYAVIAVFEDEPNTATIYFDEIPSKYPTRQTKSISTSSPIKSVSQINTPTSTILITTVLNGNVIHSVTNNALETGYILNSHIINGYTNIAQIETVNNTYIMHNNSNTIALSDSVHYGVTIDAKKIIKIPLPETEKIIEFVAVQNRLVIFTTTKKIEYLGYSSSLLPITYYPAYQSDFSLSGPGSTLAINNRLFALGAEVGDNVTALYEISPVSISNALYNPSVNLAYIGKNLRLEYFFCEGYNYLSIIGDNKNLLFPIVSAQNERRPSFLIGQYSDEPYTHPTHYFSANGANYFLCLYSKQIKNADKKKPTPQENTYILIKVNAGNPYILELYFKPPLTKYILTLTTQNQPNTTTAVNLWYGLNKIRVKKRLSSSYQTYVFKIQRSHYNMPEGDNYQTPLIESFVLR